MRILVACVPSLGHQRALVPLAAELVRRGHELCIATGGDCTYATRSGARVVRVLETQLSEDDLSLPKRSARDIDEWMLEHWFVPVAEQALAPTLDLAAEIRPNLILSDSTALWGPMAAQVMGTKLALYAPGLFMDSTDRHVALSDLNGPARPVSWRGPSDGGSFYWALERRLNRLRLSAGLPADSTLATPRGDLLLCFTTRRVELDGEGLPAQACCVGPVFGSRRDVDPAPEGKVALPKGNAPLVYVSFGNVNAGFEAPLREAVAAVRRLGLRAVVANPRGIDLGVGDDPQVAEARGMMSQSPVLLEARLLLGSGGFNTVHEALCHAVPAVAMPISGDEPALARRLEELDLARIVPEDERTADGIAQIVKQALASKRMAQEAMRFATEAHIGDAVDRAADLVEALADPSVGVGRAELHVVEALPERPRFVPRFRLEASGDGVALRSATEKVAFAAGAEARRVAWLWDRMDGETRTEELLAEEPEPQGAAALLSRLAARGMIEEGPVAASRDAQDPRYARQLAFLSHFSAGRSSRVMRPERLQEKLLSACVEVIGAGVHGSNLAWRLAGVGIGEILIAGEETVTREMLGEGGWFGPEDVDRPAAKVLAERLKAFRPDLSVEVIALPGAEGGFSDRCDLAALCTDAPDRELTERVDEACQKQGLTWTGLRRVGFSAQIGPTIVPGQTGCFNCFEQRRLGHLDDPSWLDAPAHAGLNLALGVDELTGEIVKYLTGCGEVCTLGAVAVLDPFAMTLSKHRVFRLPRCPRCGVGRSAPTFAWRPGV